MATPFSALPGTPGSPIQSPVPNPYAPTPPPVADFDPADLTVEPAAPVADFDIADVQPVADFDPADVSVDIGVYTPEQIKALPDSEVAKLKDFTPELFGAQNLEALSKDPELLDKVIRLYRQRAMQGTSVKEKAQAVISGIPEVAKALVGGATALAVTAQSPQEAAIRALQGEDLGKVSKDLTARAAELPASVETAVTGSSDLLRRSARELKEGAGKFLPGVSSKAELTDAEWRQRFFDDAAFAKQAEEAAKGNAAVMQAFGADAATLAEKGIVLNPQMIQDLSVVTDPINYIPVGATVGAVTKIGGKLTRVAIAKTGTAAQAARLAKTLNNATALAAKTIPAAGTVVEKAGEALTALGTTAEKGVRAVGGTASGLGLGGILGHDVYSALGGALVAKAGPRVAQTAGRAVTRAGEAVASPLGKATIEGAVGGFAKGVAEGAALTLPFEIGARPDEEKFLLGAAGLGGVTRGALEGSAPVAKVAGAAAQNKLAETIFKRVEQIDRESAPYGDFPELDAMNATESAKRSPQERALLNATRELFRNVGNGEVQAYVVTPAEFRARTGADALGYAFTTGERTLPDGTSRPTIQLLLNSSTDALPHELFHALETLDAEGAQALRNEVAKNLTPEQQAAFEQQYNSRINGGRPEPAWTYRLPKDKILNEIAAESFSRLLLSQDLSGVAPGVVQKAALFASSILEALGSPLGGLGKSRREAGVSNLGVRPGVEVTKKGRAWLGDLLSRLNNEGTLGEPYLKMGTTDFDAPYKPKTAPTPAAPTPAAPTPAAPTPAAPTPAAPTPANPPSPTPGPIPPEVRNIRTTRAAQDDFAGRRAEAKNVTPAIEAARKTGDAATISAVEGLSPAVESGTVVEIVHSGVKTEGFAEGRSTRRAAQEAAYIAENLANAPTEIRDAYQKVFTPVRWEIVGGKPQLVAMSLDKVLANAHKVASEAAYKGVGDLIPYEVVDGKLTDNAWGQFVDDLQTYTENQQNGYRGDGQRLERPTEDAGLSIPAENKNYTPRPLTEERMNFLNMVQGLNPPLTARVGKQSSAVVPGNVKAQILAEVNRRTPEKPAVIRPQDVTKQEFPGGRMVMETNPLRNELAKQGVPVRELIEVTERINAKDIQSFKERPDLNFTAPVTDTIRGGFLPGDTKSTVDAILAETPEEFAARFKGRALTQTAYDLGLGLTDAADLQVLRDARSQAERAFKAAGEAGDFNKMSSEATKAQFFREALEAATNSGSAKGQNPGRIAPFENDGKQFLPNEAVRNIAEDYAKRAGIPYKPHTSYDEVNVPLAKRLADFYDQAESAPEDPAVKASYQALADETLAQLKAIEDAGYTLEPYSGKGEPYKSSAEAIADVQDNKHLFFLKTEGNINAAADNPLLAPWRDGLVVNDAFRAVHDFFGHAKEGYQFGPRGEFNAWKAHSTMFTPEAQGALAAETLAQNSWVNYGAHLRNEKGDVPTKGQPGYKTPQERPFAEQKNIIIPPELIQEAKTGSTKPIGGAAFAKFFDKTENTPAGGAKIRDFAETLELPVEGFEPQLQRYLKFGSNFQKHIATSIPGFVDARIRLMAGLEDYAAEQDGPVTMLDITSSEGYFTKAWAEGSQERGADARAVALDALPAFKTAFDSRPQVPNVSFELAAWGESFTDPGTKKIIPLFKPKAGSYNIVHEGMGFQFFTPDRKNAVAEVKRILKPNGVFVTLEKFKNPDYAAREVLKDESKARFYSNDQMQAKAKEVLTPQNENAVGMSDYQFDRVAYENLLAENFNNVEQIWSSGNFAGYVASDDPKAVRTIVDKMGSTNTRFSVEETPRRIEGGQFLPKTEAGKKLIEDGYELKREEPYHSNYRAIRLFDEGKQVGVVSATIHDPKTAEISLSEIDADHRGGRVGEALYREMFAQLRDEGVTKVSGSMISGAPLVVRSRIFGKVEGLQVRDIQARPTEGLPPLKAIDLQTALKRFRDAENKGARVNAKGYNTIEPGMQFLPSDNPRAVKMAAFLDDDTGEIYEGAAHFYALKKAVDAGANEAALIDGFVTNSGEFLTREQALARAIEMKQTTQRRYEESIREFEEAHDMHGAVDPGRLESVTFNDARSFLPADIKRKSADIDSPNFDWETWKKANGLDVQKKSATTKLPKGIKAEVNGVQLVGLPKEDSVGGTLKLVRLSSRAGETEASPVNFGKGKATPIDRRGKNKVFFYEAGSPLGGDEALFQGATRYKAQVDGGRVYDASGKDPLNFLSQPNKEKADQMLQDAGYTGFYVKTEDGRRVVGLYHPVKVEEVGKLRPRATTAGQFLPADTPLLDLGLPDESTLIQERIKGRITKAKDKFPEALLPKYQTDEFGFVMKEDGKPKPIAVDYDLANSPLAKEAAKGVRGDEARTAAIAEALSKKLVRAAKEAAQSKDISAGVKWYSTARTRLKKLLGNDTKFFAELLGATSARTPVDTNFRFALDAYNQFKAGKFDAILKKYREGKDLWESGKVQDFIKETGNTEPSRSQFLDWWVKKHNLSPVQSNGRKFGANSRSVLRVLDGSWADEVQGPKTPNFAGNLAGSTFEATIDVWAARLLHRLANEGNDKRWRILPENETGVTDADFFLGQDAFRRAADELGMKPDALQAILWFFEKNYWEAKGWTKGAGAEKSDFNSLLAVTEKLPDNSLRMKNPQQTLDLGVEDIRRVSR